jgi:hypothetical protein
MSNIPNLFNDRHTRGIKTPKKFTNLSQRAKSFNNLLHPAPSPEYQKLNKPKPKFKFFRSQKNRFIPVTKNSFHKYSPSRLGLIKSDEFIRSLKKRKTETKYRKEDALTPNESTEISNIIKINVQKELGSVKKAISKRIENMNRLGILPGEVNEVRGDSLFTLYSKSM